MNLDMISFQLYLNHILKAAQCKWKVRVQSIKNECADYDFAGGSLHHGLALEGSGAPRVLGLDPLQTSFQLED